jgi:hypothetical protein
MKTILPSNDFYAEKKNQKKVNVTIQTQRSPINNMDAYHHHNGESLSRTFKSGLLRVK